MTKEPTASWQDYLVAYGVVARGTDILLVGNRWRWAERPDLVWTLPGGRAEPGEAIDQALVREVGEETGLAVQAGPLIFVVEVLMPARRQRFISFTFQAVELGLPQAPVPSPTDDAVVEARFVSSVSVVDCLTLQSMRQPVRDYLTGERNGVAYYQYTLEDT